MSQPSDGIKVVDAEPVQQMNAPNTNALNPNAIFNNTLDGFAQLGSRINPFAQRLNKGLGQVRQVMYTLSSSSHIYKCIVRTREAWNC